MPPAVYGVGDAECIGRLDEIAQLRDFDLRRLQTRWKLVFRKTCPPHLPKHLVFGILAYQLQAEALGDLTPAAKRALAAATTARSPAEVAIRLETHDHSERASEAGTILMREWEGRQYRVMVMTSGFAWNGKTYKSLSKVAFAITGTRWNGPRFFGLRDRPKVAQVKR